MDSYKLERLVYKVCNCNHLDFHGTVDAGYFKSNPYYASMLMEVCAHCCNNKDGLEKIGDVVDKYQPNYPDMTEPDSEYAQYVADLDDVVSKYFPNSQCRGNNNQAP